MPNIMNPETGFHLRRVRVTPLNLALFNSKIVQVYACAVIDTLLGQYAGTRDHS